MVLGDGLAAHAGQQVEGPQSLTFFGCLWLRLVEDVYTGTSSRRHKSRGQDRAEHLKTFSSEDLGQAWD